VEDLVIEIYAMVLIRGMSILSLSGQQVREGFIDIKENHEDN
jgi:hypothetical protein